MALNNPEKLKHTNDLIDFYKSKPEIVNSTTIDEARKNVRKYQANRDTQFKRSSGKKFKTTANCCFFDGDLVKCMFPGCKGCKSGLQSVESLCSTFNTHQSTAHGKRRPKKCVQYDLIGFAMDGDELKIMNVHKLREYCATKRGQQLEALPSRLWVNYTLKPWSASVPEVSHDDETIQICTDAAMFQAKFQSTNQLEAWEKCFMVEDSSGLGMKCPDAATILEMLKKNGGMRKRKYLDVYEGEHHTTTQKECVKLFETAIRSRKTVFNNLDMNVSMIPAFVDAIKIPTFAKKHCMVTNLDLDFEPAYERYVVMTHAKAFTDFHVDFGGTSVYFHMLKGKKTFFLVEPTEENVKKHEEYQMPGSDQWFGEMDGVIVKKVTLTAGRTFFMPGGWIHAVYTHKDSVAVSGNFFDAGCISKQLQAFRVEVNVDAGGDYRVPEFTQIHFKYMEQKLLNVVKNSNKRKRNMVSNPNLKKTWERFQELFAFLDEFKNNKSPVTTTTLAPSKAEYDLQIRIQCGNP